MQASRTLGGNGLPNSGAGVVVAIAAALLIAAGGGYAARPASSVAPASGLAVTASAPHQQAPDAADRNARLGDVAAGDDFCAAINRHKAC
jgi:hypothetical protein